MINHDSLTGLYNRKYFNECMERLENVVPISILIADIDGVRMINDTFGYKNGDNLIKAAAEILASCIKEGDILARTAGDEFSILLPNTDKETAHGIVKNIEKACYEYNKNNWKILEISMTIGSATKYNPNSSIIKTSKYASDNMRNNKLLNHKSSKSDIISSMLATVYEKSQETKEHATRLGIIARKIGEELNLSSKSLSDLELLSVLHDIGKVGIDERVLNKPGPLDEEEWEIMKKHPEIGYRIVKSSIWLEHLAKYILHHHERWDGYGYPSKLKGEEIPLLSRIITIADSYDAMTEFIERDWLMNRH